MATFEIYNDQENVGQLISKPKETAITKRTALGIINSNHNGIRQHVGFEPNNRNDEIGLPQKENLVGNLLENINEKIENQTLQIANQPRHVLSELIFDRNVQEIKEDAAKDSPMSIDDSPPASEDYIIKSDSLCFYSDYFIYKNDIYKYLRKIEIHNKPKAYYMRRQPEVTYSMRSILVDWLVEVGEEYRLHTETLFMAVSYIDRFLSYMAVVRTKLQLLGTSAMFIASKFEEIYPPDVSEFTYITDDTYSKKQVLRMEHLILKVLGFDLSSPTCYTFVVHICVTSNLSEKIMYLAVYICELSLLECDPYLDFNPSLIAASSIAMARHCLGYNDIWPTNLLTESGYSLIQLAPVVTHLNNTHLKASASSHGPIKEKYKSSKFQQVSQVPAKKLIIRE